MHICKSTEQEALNVRKLRSNLKIPSPSQIEQVASKNLLALTLCRLFSCAAREAEHMYFSAPPLYPYQISQSCPSIALNHGSIFSKIPSSREGLQHPGATQSSQRAKNYRNSFRLIISSTCTSEPLPKHPGPFSEHLPPAQCFDASLRQTSPTETPIRCNIEIALYFSS